MNILQLGKAFPPIKGLGGVERVIEQFYYGINTRNIKCDVLGVNDKYKFEIDNFCNGGLIFREKLFKKLLSTFLSLHLILRLSKISKNYDIIHVHHPDPMSFLALFFVRPKAKIILHWHSDIVKQKIVYFFFKGLEKWVLNRANLILCTTPKYYAENLILRPYLHKTNYLVIGYKKRNIISSTDIIFSEKNYQQRIKRIIFIGRLVYYKGVDYLIKSMALVNAESELLIIGDGENLFLLKELARKLNLEHKIKFLGSVGDEEKITYLISSDILVLPSTFKSEAYGIVQVEAMAYGVPVISTKIEGSGVDWVNKNGVSGIIVPACDEISLASAIDKILNDFSLKCKLSAGALTRFANIFNEDKMFESLMNYYKEVLRQ